MITRQRRAEPRDRSVTRSVWISLLSATFLVAGLILVAGPAEAGTTIDSDITTNTTWDAAGSPYNITTTTVRVVGADAPVLTIEPGVEVRFDPGTRLKVATSSNPGVLRANGTTSEPITFTSRQASPSPGDYLSLRFGSASGPTSFLENASIAYAGDSDRAGLYVVGHDLEVANVNISRSGNDGVYLEDTDVPLTNLSLWSNAGDGIDLRRSASTISNTTVEASGGYGIKARFKASDPTLDNVRIQESGQASLRVHADTDLSTTTLGPEDGERIEFVETTLTSNRTLPLPTDIDDGNRFDIVLRGDLWVTDGATLTIQPGTRLLTDFDADVRIGYPDKGSLVAQGTQADPIVLTALEPTSPWEGMLVRNGDAGTSFVLRNATIEHVEEGPLDLKDRPNVAIDNVTIDHGGFHGIKARTSTLDLHNVDINDTKGFNPISSTVDALNLSVRNTTTGHAASPRFSTVTWDGGLVDTAPNSGVWIDGCKEHTLSNLTIRNAGQDGIHVDDDCGGADLHDVRIEDVDRRAWRNGVENTYDNVTIESPGLLELDYWGTTLKENFTFPQRTTPGGDLYTPRLLSDLAVQNGSSLTVLPGTDLRFGKAHLRIGGWTSSGGDGGLDAQGTETDPITMTALSADKEWNGLFTRRGAEELPFVMRNVTIERGEPAVVRLEETPNATLDNVTIQHGSRDGLVLQTSSVDIRNVVINDTEGLIAGGTTVDARDLNITNTTSGRAADFSDGSLTWDGGSIESAPGAGLKLFRAPTTLRNVDISGTKGVVAQEATVEAHDLTVRNTTSGNGVSVVSQGSLIWEGGLVEPAPVDGVRMENCSTVTLANVTIRDVGRDGVHAVEPCDGADLHHVHLEDVDRRAWRNGIENTYDNVTLSNIGVLELDYLGGTITADQTLGWATATGDVYASRILGAVSVKESATLTVEAGNHLLMKRNVGIQIGDCCNTDAEDSGGLVVEGTVADPVTVEPIDPGDPWNQILVRNGLSTPIELRNTTVQGPNQNDLVELRDDGILDNVTLDDAEWYALRVRGSAVDARGLSINDTGLSGVRAIGDSALAFHNTTVRNVASGHGVRLDDDGASLAWTGGGLETVADHGLWIDECGIATLRDLAIKDTADRGFSVDTACGKVDVHDVHFEDIGTRAWRNPFDATYENVTFTNVGIHELDYLEGHLTTDRTLPAYETSGGDRLTHRLIESFDVSNGAELTVEPGNRIEAHDEAVIVIGKCCEAGPGSFVASGTEADPVTFTAIDPNQGWRGILTDHAASDSIFELRNVTVEKTTASTSSHAATIRDHPQAILDNVTIRDSTAKGLTLVASTLSARNILINDTARNGIDAKGGTLDLRDVTVHNVATEDGVRFHDGAWVTWNGGRVETTGALGIRAEQVSLSLANLTVQDPAELGMFLFQTDDAHLEHLEIERATTGIKLTDVTGATVKDSVITGNDLGVWIKSDATGNLLYNNKLDNPTNVDDAAADTSWNVTPEKLGDGTNICGGPWLAGNCWSDYTGEDTDGDGIGDTQIPYTIGIAGIGDEAPLDAHGPKDLRVTPGADPGIVELDWTGSIPVSDIYRILRSTSQGGPYTEIATTSETEHTDTGLDRQSYHYVVEGVWSNGVSAGQTGEASATPRPPAPANLTASQGDLDGQILLEWDAPGGFTDQPTYRVFRSTQDGGPYHLVHEAETTSHSDEGLDPTTTYHYVVTTLAPDGVESPTSTQVSASPSGTVPDVSADPADGSDQVQDDAGTGGDASDDPDDPTILAGGELIHINGTLIALDDPIDAYGTDLSPNATISMSFNFTSPATMALNLTLIAPNGTIMDTAQAPDDGGDVSVGTEADPGEHLEPGVWVTVLEHGLQPSVNMPTATSSSAWAGPPWADPSLADPTGTTSTTSATLVPDSLLVIKYHDERPCDPRC